MEFVLDDEIRRPKGRMLDGLRPRVPARGGVTIRILEVRRSESVPRAKPTHAAEEGLNLSFPGHLSELVDRGDQQRRQAAVDFLINNNRWNALAG